MNVLLAVLGEKFLSRKLGAFLTGVCAAYFAAGHLAPEAAERFLSFLQWLCGVYLSAQGVVDAVTAVKKSAGTP